MMKVKRDEFGNYYVTHNDVQVISWNDTHVRLSYPEPPAEQTPGNAWDRKLRASINEVASDCKLGFVVESGRLKRTVVTSRGQRGSVQFGKTMKFKYEMV